MFSVDVSTLKSYLVKIATIGAASYFGILALVFFQQEKLIFFPSPLPEDFKFPFNISFEEIYIKSGDDRVHSLLLKAEQSRGVIVYFHGNAGSLEGWGEVGQTLSQQTGFDVWMIDYPGYGKSSGKISSQEQLLRIAEATLAQAKERYPTGNIILFGRSLGSGIAVYLGSDPRVKALILETPYLSLIAMAKHRFPLIPAFLMKYPMQSSEWIPKVSAPILILHGNEDEVIPFTQGKELSAISKKAVFVEINRGHHNDLEEFPKFSDSIKGFLNQHTGSKDVR
ncbi:alpha/beta hydrolase [Bdellovibrio sp. ZAP7]|uniref:alpha/beta hydrolase n=1 Tax=Bdellovibrio sp. ZAP7 TaxID=2231053 RepID=UPI00115BD22E|nr:alpha/beta fold hydrolase [Bdellovibrio sp. ZAP7]QDK45380.1 alpha/beta hydrolase [Bdellovibrio sp. ZAP7]